MSNMRGIYFPLNDGDGFRVTCECGEYSHFEAYDDALDWAIDHKCSIVKKEKMKFTKDQREMISKDGIGKTVKELTWDEEGDYWVMTFTDETEIAFRFMAELQ